MEVNERAGEPLGAEHDGEASSDEAMFPAHEGIPLHDDGGRLRDGLVAETALDHLQTSFDGDSGESDDAVVERARLLGHVGVFDGELEDGEDGGETQVIAGHRHADKS